jgi:hypothetical protein
VRFVVVNGRGARLARADARGRADRIDGSKTTLDWLLIVSD